MTEFSSFAIPPKNLLYFAKGDYLGWLRVSELIPLSLYLCLLNMLSWNCIKDWFSSSDILLPFYWWILPILLFWMKYALVFSLEDLGLAALSFLDTIPPAIICCNLSLSYFVNCLLTNGVSPPPPFSYVIVPPVLTSGFADLKLKLNCYGWYEFYGAPGALLP